MTDTYITDGKEVAISRVRFSDESLRDVASFQDALALLAHSEIVTESVTNYGTGFSVLATKDKVRLVGVPFLIVDWRFNNGELGEFVSAMIVTEHGQKYVLNDGSSGIYAQLKRITEERIKRNQQNPMSGLLVDGGLSRSDYTTQLPDPKTGELVATPATTYYLAD